MELCDANQKDGGLVVMIVFGNFLQLRDVDQLRKVVEVEHRLVLTVLAEEGHVLAEIHVLEMIGDETSVTTLNALAKFVDDFLVVDHFDIDWSAGIPACNVAIATSNLIAPSLSAFSCFALMQARMPAVQSFYFTTPRFDVS
jgi:hypothetical protein